MTNIATRIIRRFQHLLDVDFSGAADGRVPVYRTASGKFEMEAVGGGSAYGFKFLGRHSITAGAQAQVDNVVTSDYDIYFLAWKFSPSSDGVTGEVILRNSSPANITGTYKSGYSYTGLNITASGAVPNLTGSTGWNVANNVGNDTSERCSGFGWVDLRGNPGEKTMAVKGFNRNASSQSYGNDFMCELISATAVAGFGFAFTSGNATGALSVYGLKNS